MRYECVQQTHECLQPLAEDVHACRLHDNRELNLSFYCVEIHSCWIRLDLVYRVKYNTADHNLIIPVYDTVWWSIMKLMLFNQHACIKVIKSESKDIYAITKVFT